MELKQFALNDGEVDFGIMIIVQLLFEFTPRRRRKVKN